jgi:hypothetical protein
MSLLDAHMGYGSRCGVIIGAGMPLQTEVSHSRDVARTTASAVT